MRPAPQHLNRAQILRKSSQTCAGASSACLKLKSQRIMSITNKSLWRFWLLVWQSVIWASLISGFVLVGKSGLEIAHVHHVTTNALSWSIAGLLLLLIGSLMNSCRKEYKFNLSTQRNPKN